MKEKKGFTLIELLVVVGIICTLAIIAVSSLISTNIRAHVTGIEAEMGSIAITLEDYKSDRGTFPVQNNPADEIGTSGVTLSNTTVAGLGRLIYPTNTSSDPVFLSKIPGDPFNNDGKEDWNGTIGAHNNHYSYFTGEWDSVNNTRKNSDATDTKAPYWALVSYGPDKDADITTGGYVEAWKAADINAPGHNLYKDRVYDSDNGVKSNGDIIVIGQ